MPDDRLVVFDAIFAVQVGNNEAAFSTADYTIKENDLCNLALGKFVVVVEAAQGDISRLVVGVMQAI